MTNEQLKLLAFVIEKHGEQKRKYTDEPYWFHVYRVGKMADEFVRLGMEIGLCHDLIEDTSVDYPELASKLEEIGYAKNAADFVLETVFHLTDQYTHEEYPTVNRKDRKALEARRLWTISQAAQTVKYCDLIDNLDSIVRYDPKFAEIYLKEKAYILEGMTAGDPKLLELAKKHTITRADLHSIQSH